MKERARAGGAPAVTFQSKMDATMCDGGGVGLRCFPNEMGRRDRLTIVNLDKNVLLYENDDNDVEQPHRLRSNVTAQRFYARIAVYLSAWYLNIFVDHAM